MIRIQSVKYLEDFKVELLLTNGKRKTVDLEPYLYGPIFDPIRSSRTLFKTIHVDKELGTVVWNNGADIDPDVLIHDRKSIRFDKKSLQLQVSESNRKYKSKKIK
ncbi:MAG: DUF2442 domain-containing protein [Ignavibacteriales bacterium]|nr:DUF2442 domain-containing protein [Ignavibacteriales bacterium]